MTRKYNIKCVICGNEATVSPIWYSFHPHTCTSKMCNKVFNGLPENIRNQFFIIHALKDDSCWHFDRGQYYSEIVEVIYFSCKEDGSLISDYDDFQLSILKDYGDWIIENCENINTGSCGKIKYYNRKVCMWENIHHKISNDEIKKSIKELIELEYTISLSADIVKLCNHHDINTYFCIAMPYHGFKTTNKINK